MYTAVSSGKRVSKGRKVLASKNTYLESLVSLYEKIAKHTTSEVVHKVAARLKMSRSNRQPIKLSKLVKLSSKRPGDVCLVIAKILDDDRVFEIPKLDVVALQVSQGARKKIEKAGGKVHTVDKLFEVCPNLDNVALFRGKATSRKAYRYFGVPGDKRSRTYPRCINKGKNREKRILK